MNPGRPAEEAMEEKLCSADPARHTDHLAVEEERLYSSQRSPPLLHLRGDLLAFDIAEKLWLDA